MAGGAAEIKSEMATAVGKSTMPLIASNGVWIIPKNPVSRKRTKMPVNDERAKALYGRQSVIGVLGCMLWAR